MLYVLMLYQSIILQRGMEWNGMEWNGMEEKVVKATTQLVLIQFLVSFSLALALFSF